MRAPLQMERNFHILHDDTQFNLVSFKGRSPSMTLRRMFRSEDIGVSLLGSLKVGDLTSSVYQTINQRRCDNIYI